MADNAVYRCFWVTLPYNVIFVGCMMLVSRIIEVRSDEEEETVGVDRAVRIGDILQLSLIDGVTISLDVTIEGMYYLHRRIECAMLRSGLVIDLKKAA